tara:strand:+ start:2130 stop:2258 length:129 start_codon:yes stop_codon:yes gene_type:complete
MMDLSENSALSSKAKHKSLMGSSATSFKLFDIRKTFIFISTM